jgi:hypothetical protein
VFENCPNALISNSEPSSNKFAGNTIGGDGDASVSVVELASAVPSAT